MLPECEVRSASSVTTTACLGAQGCEWCLYVSSLPTTTLLLLPAPPPPRHCRTAPQQILPNVHPSVLLGRHLQGRGGGKGQDQKGSRRDSTDTIKHHACKYNLDQATAHAKCLEMQHTNDM